MGKNCPGVVKGTSAWKTSPKEISPMRRITNRRRPYSQAHRTSTQHTQCHLSARYSKQHLRPLSLQDRYSRYSVPCLSSMTATVPASRPRLQILIPTFDPTQSPTLVHSPRLQDHPSPSPSTFSGYITRWSVRRPSVVYIVEHICF